MRRTLPALLLALLALLVIIPSLAAAGDFMTNPENTLFPDKVPSRAIPAGTDPRTYGRAQDWNALKGGLLDVRDDATATKAQLSAEVQSRQSGDATNAAAIAAETARATAAEAVGAASASSQILASGASRTRPLGEHIGDAVKVLNYTTCDGQAGTDDTEGIRAAIAAAAARTEWSPHDYGFGEGGRVVFPGGKVCRVTDTISIMHDSISLEGEGAGGSAIRFDFGAGTPTKDGIVFADGTVGSAGKKGSVKNLSLFQNITANGNVAASLLRDILVIAGNWARLDNVSIWSAGRYGLRVQGTLHLQAMSVRISYSGASGVYVDYYANDSDVNTTTTFYGLYSQNNQHHGVLIRQATALNFFNPIIEGNGKAGDPLLGDGVRLGVDVPARYMDVNVFGGYMERNLGWDFNSGVGLTGDYYTLNVYGMHSAGSNKSAGYGFLYATRTRGVMSGNNLLSYSGVTTYSLDNLCSINVRDRTTDILQMPVYRPSPGNWWAYNGGIVEIMDAGGVVRQYGKSASRRVDTPASASAACTIGEWAVASGYHYLCTATNTWQRVSIATW